MPDRKINLPEDAIPRRWYNVQADLPLPAPPLHPGTLNPVGPDDLAPLFPLALILQEVSGDAEVSIPDEVREAYRIWRPTPLIRADRLEQALGLRGVRIYYKNEGVSPPGSHKPNTAVAQAYYNAAEGRKRLVTETGAGQWGSSLAFACKLFGLECRVFMVKVSYEQKPYRRVLMQTWGGSVVASPSDETEAGRRILAEHPDSPGSLGIAISEAVEAAAGDPEAAYSLGSVLNHVLMHQTVIGQEALEQLRLAGEGLPDVVIGCTGGGSNFAGLAFPFLREKIAGADIDVIAAEPASCPSLTRGIYAYDYGDAIGMAPLVAMHTLGHDFVPPGIHAGGLRYHGMAPLVSHAVNEGLVRPVAYPQLECFQAAVDFAASEGIVPGPEPSHAIRAVLEAARQAEEEGREKVILFNLSGHGHFDMQAYDDFLSGRLQDHAMDEAEVARALAAIESFPKPPVPAGR
jgi:tryptophan synthase beta chain